MKKLFSVLSLLIIILTLTSCNRKSKIEYISAEDAKIIMDTTNDYIILDVRTQEEYNDGHIPGAILIPYDEIHKTAEDIIKDKNSVILVYCRTGRRSKIAAEYLFELGYKNIKEFGGINSWEYDIDKQIAS